MIRKKTQRIYATLETREFKKIRRGWNAGNIVAIGIYELNTYRSSIHTRDLKMIRP